MHKEIHPPNPERLRELLDYDPSTGIFRWKKTMNGKAEVGGIAGSVGRHGYRRIAFDGQRYRAHKLAWFLIYGEWTNLDHRDCSPDNNKISNLRKATTSQNNANRRNLPRSKSIARGIRKTKSGKYSAQVGRSNYLGRFNTLDEAIVAHREAITKFYGEFARFD